MFVVCDNMKPLSDACLFNAGFIRSVQLFLSLFPNVSSVNVYSDLRGKASPSDYQYLATINRSQLKKILSSHK